MTNPNEGPKLRVSSEKLKQIHKEAEQFRDSAMDEDEERLSIARWAFADRIPFNRVLGLRIESGNTDQVVVTFDMQENLIGNFAYEVLHGGVISAVLDVTGGVLTFINMMKDMKNQPLENQIERFRKLGTIDLRIDYLRRGAGKSFISTGWILRHGNKVTVTRMELHNEENRLIAAATGTYSVA